MLTDKQTIKMWLQDMNIKNYHINKDLTVDVEGNVNLTDMNLTELPVQFGIVEGKFNCGNNLLTSLKGSPYKTDSFYCHNNCLTNLNDGPQIVRDYYDCSNNQLTTLVGAPQKMEAGEFSCNNNNLTSLIGAPQTLDTLKCHQNKLNTLTGISNTIHTFLDISFNHNLTSLKGSPKKIRNIMCAYSPIQINEWIDLTIENRFSHTCVNQAEQIQTLSKHYDKGNNLLISGEEFNELMQYLQIVKEKEDLEKNTNTNNNSSSKMKI